MPPQFPSSWKLTPLGQVLDVRDERPSPEDLALGKLRIVSKIGFADGRIVLRDGTDTRTGMILIRPGDLLLSGINAAKGAIAIYDEKHLLPIAATIHYGAYIARSDRIDVHFLWWLFRSEIFREILNEHLPGGIKTELKPARFLPIPIPVPPLAEQRRIVSRIEELSRQIDSALWLRHRAGDEAKALVHNAIGGVIGKGWPVVPLQDAVDSERPITYGIVQAGEHIPGGVPYIRVSDMAKPRLTPEGMLRTSPEIAARYCRSAIRAGDIVFAIRATVGKMRFVPDELEGANLTQGTARIAPSEKATAPYLFWALQSREVAATIQNATKGSTFKEITLGRLRTIPVPLPPVSEQRRIVSELDRLQAEADTLKLLQSETAAELDALMPSILSRAFRGEL